MMYRLKVIILGIALFVSSLSLAASFGLEENFDRLELGKPVPGWNFAGDDNTPVVVVDQAITQAHTGLYSLQMTDNSKNGSAQIEKGFGNPLEKGKLRFAVKIPSTQPGDFYCSLNSGGTKLIEIGLSGGGYARYRDPKGQNQNVDRLAKDNWHLFELIWDAKVQAYSLAADGKVYGNFPFMVAAYPDRVVFKLGSTAKTDHVGFLDSIEITNEGVTNLNGELTVTPPAAVNAPKEFQIPADLPDNLVYYHDVEIGKGGDKILKIDICAPKNKPEKPWPVLAYIHGGGWNKGSKDEHARKIMGYAREGYVGVSIQYRLTHEAIFPGQLEDCKLAIRYLRANAAKYYLNPDKIGVWGSSAGSHLAALLGTTGDVKELEGNGGWPGVSSRVQAVVDWYGPADFTTEFANNYSSVTKLLGVRAFSDPEKAKRAMPGTYASKDDPPFLVMHGNKDTTIPYTDSVAFSEALKKAGVNVTFIIVDGAGHGFKDFPETDKIAKEFLAKHLKNE